MSVPKPEVAQVRTPEKITPTEPAGAAAPERPAGDRGIPSVNRPRTMQSRVSSALAITLMCTLGLGALTWYYAHTWHRPARAQEVAVAAARNHARGDSPLPSIGHVSDPRTMAPPAAASAIAANSPEPAASSAPQPNYSGPPPGWSPPQGSMAEAAAAPPAKSPWELALERRLAGPPFARAGGLGIGASGAPPGSLVDAGVREGGGTGAGTAAGGGDAMEALLRPTLTPTVAASMLPTRRFLLGKGTFIDCTLETAIDSSLPGMTTCITATDTYSVDGTVVLIERGTKLVGETRGQVQPGTARIFVLWTEARTPTGVVVPLSSPGTDALGRSGLEGAVNRHFWERFGAAILLTVVNGVVQGAVNSQNNGGSVVVSPTTSTDVMTEVLKNTINIPPTVTKAQGDRIQVFVARDVDFRPVYELRVANSAASALATASGVSGQ